METMLNLKPFEYVQIDPSILVVGYKLVEAGAAAELKIEFDNGAQIRAYVSPNFREIKTTAPGIT